MNDLEYIRKDGRLLYEYIRGSNLYNLNTASSDIDTGGVFVCTTDELLGCYGYKPQASDKKHDNVWYEIGNYLSLLAKSNPTMLESLFIPKDKVLGEIHPLMRDIIENRDEFISKACFKPFYGYSVSQIEKARGTNKKMVNPIEKRLQAYDFIYTFKDQGSTHFKSWLSNNSLHQEFCGVNNTPNMHEVYGVFYDFGQHQEMYPQWREDNNYISFASRYFNLNREDTIKKLEEYSPKGYRGVIEENATQLKLTSIEKRDEMPICHIMYNQSGFSLHCKLYKEYQDWVKNRNEARYLSNLESNYDAKNMMHCFRMIHMAKEIAGGEGLILERTWDREFLLNVRNHKYEYEYLMDLITKEKDEMQEIMDRSTIKEKVDPSFVNQLLIDIRKKQLGI